MSELSVRETAARIIARRWNMSPRNKDVLADTDAVLAAVGAHGGLADVLRGHATRQERVVHNGPDPCGDNPWRITCLCGEAWTGVWLAPLVRSWADHLADVVRAWLRDPS